MASSPLKEQIGGTHYKKRAIQPIEFALANNLAFCEGNIIKYVTRWRDKGGVEDLRKARHYLDFLIEDAEKQKAPAGAVGLAGIIAGAEYPVTCFDDERHPHTGSVPRRYK